mmetsp:Transcript_26495/g.47755  ORF Transcript_26495/g.47755 Transcript_26495/m.47755 type:complete len:636 (-) Transcript_26495:544-2451(-)
MSDTSSEVPNEGSSGPIRVLLSANTHSVRAVYASQRIRSLLYTYGIHCQMGLTTLMGGTRWRKEMSMQMRQCQVLIPVITTRWAQSEENILELYYGLRLSTLHGSPLLFPVFFPEVLESIDEPHFWAAKLLRDSCFHAKFEQPVSNVADQILWFLTQLKFGIKELSIGKGHSLAEIYTKCLQQLGGKRPNSGVMRMLDQMQDKDLKELNLANNYIGDLGLKALCHIMDMMPNLVYVNLSGNGITNAAVSALVNTLVGHPCIVSLDLSNNELSHCAAAELFWLIRRNEQITELKLQGNSVKTAWQKRINSKLAVNRTLPFAACNSKMQAQSDSHDDDCPVPIERPVDGKCNKWCITMTVTLLDADPKHPNISLVAEVKLVDLDQQIHRKTLTYADPLLTGHEVLEHVRTYLRSYEANTISVSRYVGTTVKLVLEDIGTGMEALQQLIRKEFARTCTSAALCEPDVGSHRVEIRFVVNCSEDTPDRNFFIEGMVAYQDMERVAKTLMKLYRPDIMRYQGNLRDEVEWLVPRMFANDMLTDEDLALLAKVEQEEADSEQQKQDSLMEDVLTYWKCTPAFFKKTPDAWVNTRFRAAANGVSSSSQQKAACGSLPPELKAQCRQHELACLKVKSYPPYAY